MIGAALDKLIPAAKAAKLCPDESWTGQILPVLLSFACLLVVPPRENNDPHINNSVVRTKLKAASITGIWKNPNC